MCGIAGSVHLRLNIERLKKDLWHRGPDEQTTYTDDNVCLHHHRLAILDIAGGHQPMHFQDLTIVFNGEIYNHLDVRQKYNLQCQSHSDTETILQAYVQYGAACLHDFDGMFALAIYDKKSKRVFIARDRAGKKPLYYYCKNGQFIFSSELNALNGQLSLSINEDHIQQYIRMGFNYGSATAYRNVMELPAGSYAYVSTEHPEVKPVKWWNIATFYHQPVTDNLQTTLDKTDAALHKAIKNRVESSDLEVGSFLSGGIDSGLVTAIAKKYNSNLKTFTVSFPGEYDEAPLAKLVAEKYETSHHEIKISFDHLLHDTEHILSNYGEPHFDDSAIPSFYVSREAKKYLTVILNGDGGDELFGGYRRYIPFSKVDFFKKSLLRNGLFSLLYHLTPVSESKMSKLNYFKRMFFLGSRSGINTYLSATTDIFEGFEKKIFRQAWKPEHGMMKDFNNVFHSDLSGLQKMMLLDFNNILPSLLLVKMDIATMAHSLEGRSPLLCKDLLEYIPSIADNFKIRGTTTKYLLRSLAQRYLPGQLIHQPKRGFEPPLKHWVNHELKNLIGDYLVSGNALYPQYINKEFVNNLVDDKIKTAPEKRAKMLWLLFTLEVWYKKVYKEKKNA